jgi:hypothetical protein
MNSFGSSAGRKQIPFSPSALTLHTFLEIKKRKCNCCSSVQNIYHVHWYECHMGDTVWCSKWPQGSTSAYFMVFDRAVLI